jgi:hypothetical protein
MTNQPAIIFSLPDMTRAFGQFISRNRPTGLLHCHWFTQDAEGCDVIVTVLVHPADVVMFVPTRLEAAGMEDEFNEFVSFYMTERDLIALGA